MAVVECPTSEGDPTVAVVECPTSEGDPTVAVVESPASGNVTKRKFRSRPRLYQKPSRLMKQKHAIAKSVKGKTKVVNTVLNRSKTRSGMKPNDSDIMTATFLDGAREIVDSCSSHGRDLDVVIIPPPPSGQDSDNEFIDEDGTGNIDLDPIVDVPGTFEVHNGREGIEEGTGDLTNYLDFSIKVKDIVKDEKTSISEKVTLLHLMIPDANASCTWKKATSVTPSTHVSLESDELDALITQNRSNVITEHGGQSPHEIFEALLDWDQESLLDLLVNETNRYAHEVRNDPTFQVDRNEMKVFIGILILSGYHRLPGAPMYWDTNVDTTCHIAANAMSKARFETIKKYIHCCDNNHLDLTDKYAKVRPLYDITNNRLRTFGQMHPNLSIDEQMVPYTGMHSAKQRMKDKSIRFGYKNFVLAGSDGFPYHIVPYVGAKGVAGDPGKDLTSRITLQLALNIPHPKGTHLFFDNWFGSYKVLAILTGIDVGATCTLQNNRQNSCPISSDAQMKKQERGHHEAYVDTWAKITVLKWYDNNVVRIGSNFQGAAPVSFVERFSREKKKKVLISRPAVVLGYNQSMGGVDVLDGHVASYRISLRGKKWWWMHFVNSLDVLKSAAYSIYCISVSAPIRDRTVPDHKLTYLEFIRRIVIHYLRPRERVIMRSEPIKRKAIWKGDERVPKEIRLDGTGHWPKHVQTQKRCAVASCTGRSVWVCEKCNVGLCLGANKACYKIYHTLE